MESNVMVEFRSYSAGKKNRLFLDLFLKPKNIAKDQ